MGIDLNDWKWSQIGSDNRRRVYRWYCDKCGTDKGFQRKTYKFSVCSDCKVVRRRKNPPNNIDLNDWRWEYPAGIATRFRVYAAWCTICGESQGYLNKTRARGQLICKSCRHAQCLAVQHPNIDTTDWIIYEGDNYRYRIYRTSCIFCGKDRGYVDGSKITMRCRDCYDREVHKKSRKLKNKNDNINWDSKKIIKSKRGLKRTVYLMTCYRCGNSRGYKPLSAANHLCHDCVTKDHHKKIRGSRDVRRNIYQKRLDEAWGPDQFSIVNPENFRGILYPVKLLCNTCGKIVCRKRADAFVKRGCPTCHHSRSRGELKILKFLALNKLEFIQEATFKGCVDKTRLQFDFYIPSLHLCIEYDGIHHYQEVEFYGTEAFKVTQKHDTIKNKYCSKNGITLLRISYKDFDRIEEILKKVLREQAA